MLELATVLAMTTPAAGALVGWGTNALAVRMLFEPLERRGLGPLAWQGVIPSQATSMAEHCADLLLGRLVETQELYRRLDRAELTALLAPQLRREVEAALGAVLRERYPRAWGWSPRRARAQLLEQASDLAPRVVATILERLEHELEEHLNLRALIVRSFEEDRALLGELFRRCGGAEFRFVIRTGVICGLVLGLFQLLAWSLWGQPWWIFPIVGALTGGATNWLALFMVFAPAELRAIGPFRVQGLFLKRQAEVSAAYARFFAERILAPERVLTRLQASPRWPALVEEECRRAVIRTLPPRTPAFVRRRLVGVQDALGGELKERLASQRLETGPLPAYLQRELDVEATLRDRLESLSPKDFVSILRPVFQAEEWRLTAIGAGLGAVAGLIQGLVLLL
jgi:uncharacterized membrane protein YheB (UPF0754 family)